MSQRGRRYNLVSRLVHEASRKMMGEMKFTIAGLFKLKPFDEEAEAELAQEKYKGSRVLRLSVGVTAAMAVCGLMLTVLESQAAMRVTFAAVGASAVTAGMEWNAGLRARALNQLFVTVVFALFVAAMGLG